MCNLHICVKMCRVFFVIYFFIFLIPKANWNNHQFCCPAKKFKLQSTLSIGDSIGLQWTKTIKIKANATLNRFLSCPFGASFGDASKKKRKETHQISKLLTYSHTWGAYHLTENTGRERESLESRGQEQALGSIGRKNFARRFFLSPKYFQAPATQSNLSDM